MPTVPYVFDDRTKEIEVTDGSPAHPVIVLLHGTGGTRLDMTDPANGPGNNYNHRGALPADVNDGFHAWPGIGVVDCCALDPFMEVVSWRDRFVQFKFRTAVYDQVDRSGFLARPVRELRVVMDALYEFYGPETEFVLLGHSRGGLLIRKFLKDNPNDAARICLVITLHAPHTGSSLASIADFVRSQIDDLRDVIGSLADDLLGWLYTMADSDAFREMVVGGPFLTDLANGETALPGINYFTFGGVSVRLSRIRSVVFSPGSAVPQWHWPPFEHIHQTIELPLISPVVDSLPNVIPELSDGRGDILTDDSRARLPFAVHQTNSINHAEALWDPLLQAQVLRLLGVTVTLDDPPPGDDSFWG